MKIIKNINEEKKTVVFIIKDYERDITRALRKRASAAFRSFLWQPDINPLDFKEPIVGKAKCHPLDTFDAEKGMEIAKKKAFKKYQKKLNRAALIYNKKFSLVAHDLMELHTFEIMGYDPGAGSVG